MRYEEVIGEAIEAIEKEIRPKLDRDKYDDGYDCCGCSSYEQIVDDIVELLQKMARLW